MTNLTTTQAFDLTSIGVTDESVASSLKTAVGELIISADLPAPTEKQLKVIYKNAYYYNKNGVSLLPQDGMVSIVMFKDEISLIPSVRGYVAFANNKLKNTDWVCEKTSGIFLKTEEVEITEELELAVKKDFNLINAVGRMVRVNGVFSDEYTFVLAKYLFKNFKTGESKSVNGVFKIEALESHAGRYSVTYKQNKKVWSRGADGNFEEMIVKTALKKLRDSFFTMVNYLSNTEAKPSVVKVADNYESEKQSFIDAEVDSAEELIVEPVEAVGGKLDF